MSKCCNKPLRVIDATGGETRYDYDDVGRLTQVTDPAGRSTIYRYNRKSGKIDEISFPDNSSFVYSYDRDGRLVGARSSKWHTLQLIYNKVGRVKVISQREGPAFLFTYNARGRPVKIEKKGGGGLLISYDAEGNVKKVDATKGTNRARLYKELKRIMAILEPVFKLPV